MTDLAHLPRSLIYSSRNQAVEKEIIRQGEKDKRQEDGQGKQESRLAIGTERIEGQERLEGEGGSLPTFRSRFAGKLLGL